MKSFAVIGLGRFGGALARTLYELGHDVLAVDIDQEIVQNISNYVTHAVQADADDEAVLKSLGLRNFDCCIVSIGGALENSILTTLMLKELGVKEVVAKAQSKQHERVLTMVGADRVVFPEKDMGIRLANSLVSTNILDYLELSKDYSVIEIKAPADWAGQTLANLSLRVKRGVNIIAIKHGDDINISPRGDDIIKADDILVTIGENKVLNDFNLI